MNFRLDFSEEYREFEKSTYDNLNEVVNCVLKNGVYLNLIMIDMTYLNSKYGQEPGNLLKSKVLNFLKEYKNKGTIIHYTFVSSKFFFFTKNKIDFKKEINALSNEIKSKYNIVDKDILYIIDEDNHNKKSFFIEPKLTSNLESDFKYLFLLILEEENNLNELRAHFSSYLNKLDKLGNSISQRDLNEFNLFWDSYFFSKKGSIEMQGYLSNFDSYIRTYDCQNKIKNSKYLQNALVIYNNYKSKNYDLMFGIEELVKYFIWIKMQEALFYAYKIEKAYSFFNREHDENRDTKENIVSFREKEDLLAWFQNSIRVFEPILNSTQKVQAKQILDDINSIDSKSSLEENFDKLKKLRDDVESFFDNLHIKGMFSVPLEKIHAPESARRFFAKQLYLNYGSEYRKKFELWYKQDFIREGFFTIVDKPKNMYSANRFINYNFYSNSESSGTFVKFHLAFLEIDGFNSLNNVYFPNDSDSIIYQQIIELLYDLIEKELEKNQDLFKTLVVSIMGDEFFFLFSTLGEISNAEKSIIESFLENFNTSIIKKFGKIKFPKTSKVSVSLKNSSVVFRTVLYKSGFAGFGKEITMEIARLGITGGISYNKKDQGQTEFNKYIDDLDSYISNTGKVFHKGKIREIK